MVCWRTGQLNHSNFILMESWQQNEMKNRATNNFLQGSLAGASGLYSPAFSPKVAPAD